MLFLLSYLDYKIVLKVKPKSGKGTSFLYVV